MATVRTVASESEAVALYIPTSPILDESPYHTFARCPPTAIFGKPRRWPGPEGSATTARLLWNEEALYVCWELEGVTAAPVQTSEVDPACLEAFEGGKVQPSQRTVLLDERVECFLWPQNQAKNGAMDAPPAKRPKTEAAHQGETYYAFEINYSGKALTNKAKFGGPMGFHWGDESVYAAWTQEMAVGWGGSASPVPSAVAGLSPPFKRVVVAELKWRPMEIDPSTDIRIGLHRAQYPTPTSGERGTVMGKPDVDGVLSTMVWTSWVDPGDGVVNFHRPELFGKLKLIPAGSNIDNSSRAARLIKPRVLRILPSPKPSIEECPAGSLIVKGKYASVCGSDMPYFQAKQFKAPSCYWDRDGFCGHEVVGIVVESKSAKFQPGDPVMALPSSYFKAHAGSKQEWFRQDVHGVLLEEFPVRGGFCELYTSHEIYAYRIKECVPRMLAAQGLGTVLRMARKVGSVLGKTVVVVGQGQNGLIATRLMAQMCAKTVIAVETLEYRRALGLQFGANYSVAPSEALDIIHKETDGRGADVVLEMVGHNQGTINTALDYVRCSGTVAAFGVPDDAIYNFEFSKFFRKNVNLIASVIPDPGTDFPEAVQLVDQGRFNTDGIFTHVIPLEEVEKAFTIASDYQDGVVKLVIKLY